VLRFRGSRSALTMKRKEVAALREENACCRQSCRHGAVNMEQAMLTLMRIIRCDRGATAIEYALVGALISVAAIGAMSGLGIKIGTMYNNVSSQM
jgi:pilus assembly protein Flp/PilA